jgi:hypothetical protein
VNPQPWFRVQAKNEEPRIHEHRLVGMGSGLAAELAIGPATSGRIRWRQSGVTLETANPHPIFQQHYTPSELLKGDPGPVTVDLDGDGNPNCLLNPLLAELGAHIRMINLAGIDASVLTCGSGFDQADIPIAG